LSSYAYRDKLRTQVVFATEITINDENNEFYCRDSNCNAKMTWRNGSTVVNKKPYFSALKSKPHIDGCKFKNEKSSFNENRYDESLFKFIQLVDEYIEGNVQIIKRRLFTLSQIFFMCKSKNMRDVYGDTNIGKILCDNRSNIIYKNGILGPRLVECKFYKYNTEEKSIFFKYPLDDNKENKYKLKISFAENPELFLFVRRKVYNTSTSPIIIIGKWYWQDGYCTTSFANKHQIYTPFKKS